jgi:hypothetical protein
MDPGEWFRPGDTIAGKYRVRGVIGQGGVGVVVAADHLTLRCPVAIKFVRPEIARDPDVARRFVREAHAAARLRSAHVARVMDADTIDGGPPYLVMELLEGRDFGAIVKDDGPLPVAAAVDYVVQACEAVAEAHAAGIVHRDIKAANLFLTRAADGTPLVKVLDFGLSKIQAGDGRPSHASLTSANHVVGSPHYMAPEQMRSSRDADARSDIWALGVVLYTLLAGRVPFKGTYLTEVCAAVLSGAAAPLTEVRPEVPQGLADVVARCMRLEPEDRYQSVVELVAALEPFARVAPEPSPAAVSARAVPARAADPVSPIGPRAPAPVAPRVSVRWGLALLALAIAGAVVVNLRRASRAGEVPVVGPAAVGAASLEPPPQGAPAVAASAPPTTDIAGAVPAATTAATMSSPAPAARARAPVHRAPAAAGSRVAAPAPPVSRFTPRKGEEDLILALPH